jgi:hypothetical protein
MKVPFGEEIDEEFRNLGISLVPHNIVDGCIGARESLPPNVPNGRKLSGSTFWEISPCFRFDILAFDIPQIARQLAYGIAQASIYVPHVQYSVPIVRNKGHSLFWYHVDFATRVASSGWDRLALLLDLAFRTDLNHTCNLTKVLTRIVQVDSAIADQDAFKRLTRFRDGPFQELEARRGEGARHETNNPPPDTKRPRVCRMYRRDDSKRRKAGIYCTRRRTHENADCTL